MNNSMEVTQQLQKNDCLQILERLNIKDFHLHSFEILTFHSPLQGLVGDHFTLRIRYVKNNETKCQDFFVKTISKNPLMLEFSKLIQVYEKEALFYRLLEDFENYNIDTSFAPKGYFFKPYVVVLQDLSELGFKGTPKRKLLDLEHCKVCVDTIAKFHAASIIYEKKKSKESGRKYSLQEEYETVLEDKFSGKEDNLATKWMTNAVQGLFQLIDLIPDGHVSHDRFKAKLSELLSVEEPPESKLSALVHGDLWTSNFLYLYEKDMPSSGKLVDYQLIKYGPVELDLMEFLMTNTRRDFRSENLESLIRRYHKNLKKLLAMAGLGEIAGDSGDFVRSCGNFELAGKIHAVVDHSFTFVSDEVYAEAVKTEESFRNFLFEERGRCVLESYGKNEEFRNALTEDVLELRDLLFSQ